MITRKESVALALALGAAIVGVWASATLSSSRIPDILPALCYLVGMTVFPGVATYVVTRHDFRRRTAAMVTAVCVLLLGVGSWLGFIFPFLVFLVAMAAYLVMRRLIRVGPALTASAVILVGGLVFSVLAMKVAIDRMG